MFFLLNQTGGKNTTRPSTAKRLEILTAKLKAAAETATVEEEEKGSKKAKEEPSALEKWQATPL